jgi:hypothetical protein
VAAALEEGVKLRGLDGRCDQPAVQSPARAVERDELRAVARGRRAQEDFFNGTG